MTVTLPETLQYGYVKGRYILAIGDQPEDIDSLPNAIPAVGTITFSPALRISKETTVDPPTTVIRTTINCTLDSTGRLTDPAGASGVYLITGVYKVSYNLIGVTIANHDILVTSEHTAQNPLDLTLAAPSSTVIVTPSQYAELSARIDAIDADVYAATTDVAGISELATTAETIAGTDIVRVVTPAGVKAALDAKAASDMSTYAAHSRTAEPLPLVEVTVAARGADPIPAEFFSGYIWGVEANGVIKRSNDGGATWTTYTTIAEITGGRLIQRILPTDDGEVIVATTDTVYRSTGWAGGSPTWATVLTNPTATHDSPSLFYPWGVDGDGTKFIAVHYGGSSGTFDRTSSRYGWISVDGGLTWTVVWDSEDLWGVDGNALTHLHGACYDPWEDRFFISEGHDYMTGVYVSEDDGATWTRVPYSSTFSGGGPDGDPGNAPTTLVATDHGIVMGTDDPTNGILVLPRGWGQIERAWSRMGISNTILLGYAHMGARDPSTGIVYNVYELNQTYASDIGAAISGSDGQVAAQVWAGTEPTHYLWRRVVVDSDGNLLAWEQTQDQLLRAKTAPVGVRPAHLLDTGRVLGGTVTGGRKTLAVGAEAVATGGTAVGGGATTSSDLGVALGIGAASIVSGTAVGASSAAEATGVAVGYSAISKAGTAMGASARVGRIDGVAVGGSARAVTDANSALLHGTAVGYQAKASNPAGYGTALGSQATASGAYSTALGAQADATMTRSTAVGQNAKASTAVNGTALGADATCTHEDSVALGRGTATTATSQVAIGTRYIEMAERADVAAPATDAARLYVRDNGSGKTQVCVRFASGVVQVIATEP